MTITTLPLVLVILCLDALISQAEDQGRLVAGLIAEGAYWAEMSQAEVEDVVRDELESQAIAVAEMTRAAEEAGETADLSMRYAEIVAKGRADSIWLVQQGGGIVASSIGVYGALLQGDRLPKEIDARLVEAVTSGQRFTMSASYGTGPHGRRFVGVRVKAGLAVFLLQDASFLRSMRDTTGLPVLVGALASQPEILAVKVLDEELKVIAGGGRSIESVDYPTDLVRQALTQGRARSALGQNALFVAAPITDQAGIAYGVTLIELSTERLSNLADAYLRYGGIAAAIAFLLGAAIAALSARRVVRPVGRLTRAAQEVDERIFEPDSIDDLTAGNGELGTLARVFRKMAIEVQAREEMLESQVRARTLELSDKNRLLEDAQRRVDSELEAARSLQAAILPPIADHRSYKGAAAMIPARELGGDFYDVFPVSPNRLGIVVADVSGKGVPAAFFMAISRTVIRVANRDHADDAGAVLAAANDVLCAQNPHEMFVTVFYGILELDCGVLTYSNGGHNKPVIVRAADGTAEWLPTTGGIALGVMPGLPYRHSTARIAPGDTLFLYSDGVTEAMDTGGRPYGDDRLIELLAGKESLDAGGVLAAVIASVDRFVGEADQSDDITAVVLRYLGPG